MRRSRDLEPELQRHRRRRVGDRGDEVAGGAVVGARWAGRRRVVGRKHVVVIKRQSKSFLRSEMFKRLNTGGSPLSSQEIKNYPSRMIGQKGRSGGSGSTRHRRCYSP